MATQTNFEKAFAELIGNEGGYKRQSTDRMDWTGGQVGKGWLLGTKFGLSAGTYPLLDIPNLTLDEARGVYKREWWDGFKGDLLPYELAFQIFDSEVNHGHKMGVKFLQRALGFPVAQVDGILGPITLRTLSDHDEDQIIMRFLAIRLNYFTECKTWNTDGRGWAKRVAGNLLKATEPN